MNLDNLSNKINENISLILQGSDGLLSGLYDDAMLVHGKRLRAKMFFAFSKDTAQKSLDIASAIELLHSATLIHDDIVDNSLFRRGSAALYTKHGIANSLLYGDYLVTSAFLLIAKLDDNTILRHTADALKQVLEGEIAENKRCGDISLTKQEYLSVIERKSGVFFGLACGLGAQIRGADEKTIEACRRFGINIGMAYQVMDDLLDYFGKDKGRQLYKDLSRGIVTLPLIYLFEKCPALEKQAVASILNNKNLDDSGISLIISLMRNYKIPADVAEDIKGLAEKACTLLPKDMLDDFDSNFNIFTWIGEQIADAEKEYCNSRRGFRGP